MRASTVWHGEEAFAEIEKGIEARLNAVGRHLQTAIKRNISTPSYKAKKGTSRKRKVRK